MRIVAAMSLAAAIAATQPAAADGYYFRGKQAVMAAVPKGQVALSDSTLPAAAVGTPWSFDFAALATAAPAGAALSWKGSNLPSWMTLDAATGRATGTPDAVGDVSPTVSAALASDPSATASRTFALKVGSGTLASASISSGVYHSCALGTGGDVRCWGAGTVGQLGDGRNANSAVPVTAIASGAVAVAVGGSTSCAIMADRTVACWGRGNQGQLGNDGTSDSPVPVAVRGLTGATAIAVGQGSACAIVANGGLACWGGNGSGQLGKGDYVSTSRPGALTFASGVTQVATGPNATHFCAIASGNLWCWGNNPFGQLGSGPRNVTAPNPLRVSLSGVTALGIGSINSCAIASGAVHCWGYNYGHTADANGEYVLTPQPTSITSGAAKIIGGGGHNCAIMTDGTMRCMGGNSFGQLGRGFTSTREFPGTAPGLSGIVSGSAGDSFTCAVLSGGETKCWGRSVYGELGDGQVANSVAPVAVRSGG